MQTMIVDDPPPRSKPLDTVLYSPTLCRVNGFPNQIAGSALYCNAQFCLAYIATNPLQIPILDMMEAHYKSQVNPNNLKASL